ncbi:M23 family metallopeptidase [Streptomyces sp. NPDC048277]|uniref:M23 family metallopeptidase n=1 Tax=Streptomyces sp. NPDC048277 TaxID=3155027 RepID=UPI0033C8FB98
MRTDDLRLFTAALVLLLTGAFLTTPAKAATSPESCAFGTPSTPPPPETGTTAGTAGGTAAGTTGGTAGGTAAGTESGTPAGAGTGTGTGTGTGSGTTSGTASRTEAGVEIGASGWTAPTVGYRLSAGYAAQGSHWKHRHTGQDFAVDSGTPVYAVGPGRVVTATCGDGFGNQVVVQHPDGYYTQYAHLSLIEVRPGQDVSAGQRVGAAGATGNATGPHLHFEVRTTPSMGSAIPPLPWLRAHGVPIPGDPAGIAQSSKIPAQPPTVPRNDQTAPHGSPEVRPPHHDGRPPAAAGLPS